MTIQNHDFSDLPKSLRFYRCQASADFLDLSRPYLYKLIKMGILPELDRPLDSISGYYADKLELAAKILKDRAAENAKPARRPGPGRPRKNS